MKSRAISALVFGFCFGLIFMLISLFTPPIEKEDCRGVSYKIYGIDISSDDGCTGGSMTKSVGLPFATRERYIAPAINYQGLGIEDPSTDFEYKPLGIFTNLLAYWAVGFLFFFIFARSKNRDKRQKT